MDYNRLLKENDSLAETNAALKKRIKENELAGIEALKQHAYFNGKTVEELKAEGYCIAIVKPVQLTPVKPVPYISAFAGKGSAPAFIYNDVEKHRPAAPRYTGTQFNHDGEIY